MRWRRPPAPTGHLCMVGGGSVGDVLSLIVPVAFTAVTAPRSSYRAVDAVAWILPVLGLSLFVKIAEKLPLSPYRDWPLRPDDVSRCRRLSPGSSLYVRN